jgi:hypothetical protein
MPQDNTKAVHTTNMKQQPIAFQRECNTLFEPQPGCKDFHTQSFNWFLTRKQPQQFKNLIYISTKSPTSITRTQLFGLV